MATTRFDWIKLLAAVLEESDTARSTVMDVARLLTRADEPEPEPEPAKAEPATARADDQRVCPDCGKSNHVDAPFCFHCGRDVDATHDWAWCCVRCGTRMGPGSIACGMYGCNLERKPGQGTGPDPYRPLSDLPAGTRIDPKPGFVCTDCGQTNGKSHNLRCGRCGKIHGSNPA